MKFFTFNLILLLAIPFAPLLIVQGIWVRFITPQLPEASGDPQGDVNVSGSRPIRLLVIGESTVSGVGVATQGEAISAQIAHSLAKRTNNPVQWKAVGGNGFTARECLREFAPQIEKNSADVVALVLGVNDTTHFIHPARWERDLEQFIYEIRERIDGVPIILSGVPPIGQFPTLPQPLRALMGYRATTLDRVAQEVAQRCDDVIHCAIELENQPEYFCKDRFHPSATGYAIWGDHMAEAIVAMREKSNK
jgi:lysophospholipase L1-like esterase